MKSNLELFLCSVESSYLKFLHKLDSKVSVKYNNRPYVGLITMINAIEYVIPLTSQTTDKRIATGKNKRSARITTFVRDTSGNEIANILHNNMIPVLPLSYKILNINASEDTYEANEIRFLRKNKYKIIQKAQKVHDDRIKKPDIFLLKQCCDFSLLESQYLNFNL